MAVSAFISFFDKADGESVQKGKEKWVEVHAWRWEVEAETSWTKGGGASVGKPNPGRLVFVHDFDTASPVILGYICSGKAFPKVELQMAQAGSTGLAESWYAMRLEGVFITKVSNASTAEGVVLQEVEIVFKTIRIDYRPQEARSGRLGTAKTFQWDIPAGTASPSA